MLCREFTAANSDDASDNEVLEISKGIKGGSDDEPEAPQVLWSFYGIETASPEARVLEEPEFIVTEMTLDTAATTHAADSVDFPEQEVRESGGSTAGQTFGCAGGKRLANEGEVNIVMVASGGIECEIDATI